jgi:hypothetical protein
MIGELRMRMRRGITLCCLLLGLGSAIASASTTTSDITDMWWNPAESGWGVNVILQQDVAFLTFFVYDAARNPVWYTSDAHRSPSTFTWTGKLYATAGPWFGGPFTPSSVNVREAGSVTFTASNLNQATLTYTVDGVSVTKAVQRQTWAAENYTGGYGGGYSVRQQNCSPPAQDGLDEVLGALGITHDGTQLSASLVTTTGSCNFAGTYGQTGKLGQVQGTYSCTNGVQGTFTLSELMPTISGFTGRMTGANQYCQFSGFFGGLRRSP